MPQNVSTSAQPPTAGGRQIPMVQEGVYLCSLGKDGKQIQAKPSLRYAACGILSDTGTTYCIWAEDALLAYSVPTVTFDLFLVVRDPDEAAEN